MQTHAVSSGLALILGLGASGLAAARHLALRGWKIRAADTRTSPAGADVLKDEMPDADIHTGGLPLCLLDGVSLLVMSPGLSPEFGEAAPLVREARVRQIDVAGEIELFARSLNTLKAQQGYNPTVIGITGTNGKTTTTTLVARMAQAGGKKTVAAGNIGPNAVTELDKALASGDLPEVWVLELSSFQLATTSSLFCHAAAVLNVTEDHLDWHGGMSAYTEAKARIFKPGTIRVVNRDDPLTEAMKDVRGYTFGGSVPQHDREYGLRTEGRRMMLALGTRSLFPEQDLLIAGRHNTMNALAALALIRGAGLSEEGALQALRVYAGEAHRVERVLETDGVLFVDDSKGTNVGAVAAAVKGFSAQGRRILILLGGDGKGQDFNPLAQALSGVAGAIALIGMDADRIGSAVCSVGVPTVKHKTLEDAVDWLWTQHRPGDVLLLSPACASWDMFKNYAERSARFIECAHRIAKGSDAC